MNSTDIAASVPQTPENIIIGIGIIFGIGILCLIAWAIYKAWSA